MSKHIFEAQMFTVGLDKHPYVQSFMDAYFNNTTFQLTESFDNTQVDSVSLRRLAMRANTLCESAKTIYNSNLPDVVKAVNLATIIMEGPKPKRGQQVKMGNETYKFVGHSWVQHNPEATKKKDEWMPVKDKELKTQLIQQAQKDLEAKAAEEKREKGRAAIQRDKDNAEMLKYQNALDNNDDAEWEAEQQRQADEYRSKQDQEWADAEQQRSMADQIKQMQQKQQAPEVEPKQDFSQVKGNNQGYQMDAPKKAKPDYSKDISQASYNSAPETPTEEPSSNPKVDSFVQQVAALPENQRQMVEKLLPVEQPWADYVIDAILAGDVQGAIKRLSSDK